MHRFAYPWPCWPRWLSSYSYDRGRRIRRFCSRFREGLGLASLGCALWFDAGIQTAGCCGVVDGKPSGLFADGKSVTTGLLGGYVAVEIVKLGLGFRSKRATASPCLLLPPWPSDDSAASFMDAATASQQHFRGEWILAMEFSVIRLSCMRVCFIWPVRWHSSLRDVCLN